jgi:hypothetical protein
VVRCQKHSGRPACFWLADQAACHIRWRPDEALSHWDSWSGQIALGTGVGSAVNPVSYKLTPAAVVVYLYDLVTRHGKAAYTKMNFEPVPTKNARTLKAC